MKSELATLLRRKFPDRPRPHRKAPAWMPAELAAIYTQIGAGTVIAPFHGRVLSPAECKAEKAVMTSIDERGEWFGASWQPFAKDAGGGLLCLDTATGRLVFHDAATTGNPPKVIASSVAAWLKATMGALKKVPDPPDPDEDDYLEEEQEERFEALLRAALMTKAKPAAKPKPRADVPPRLAPPDEDIPKAIQIFATFEETKKHAIDGLYVARGVGTVDGETRLASIGMAGYRDAWPKEMSRLVFHHGRDARHQGHAALVYLDRKRLEAFVTLDDFPDAAAFVKTIDRMLKKLGFKVNVIDDDKHRARVVKRFQTYLDG